MKDAIELITEIVNIFHDIIMELTEAFGLEMSDKDLHFWVIGIIGIFTFGITHIIFKAISKWSLTAISFLYTFTVLIVFVFAIEIQQKITGRGNMEFADAIVGLYGFIIFFLAFLVLKLFINFISEKINKRKDNNRSRNTRSK
ncbi:hypothetical protein [Neobacillus niacini]|uniref:hypothetical protein n=1 Tax=Neobacillus niacini TaxID=86668 RepID=UPI0005EE4278|nr:hypothetical protein [Neobacillus niacini]